MHFNFILHPLAFLFGRVVALRHFAYDQKWLFSYRSKLPIISVGNIAVGGTGKTPLVQLLASELSKQGKVGIISRGFKSKNKAKTLQISKGQGPLYSQEICGDEPFFLAEQTKSPIWIGKNKTQSVKAAEQENLLALILDDGMQHRRLQRNFEIVVIHGKDPFGRGALLPAGRLRDLPSRLKVADLIVITHVESQKQYEHVKEALSSYTKAPCVGTQHTFLESSFLVSTRVTAFCGIGSPEIFYQQIEKAGATLLDTFTLGDHISPSHAQLTTFIEKSCRKGASCVVCTEKDAVKLKSLTTFALPIVPVPMQLEVVFGKEEWKKALEQMVKR